MRYPYWLLLLFLGRPASAQSNLSAHLDSFFRIQPPDGPGFVLSIEKNGEVVYRNTAGLSMLSSPATPASAAPAGSAPGTTAGATPGAPLDSNSNFRMASVTKQFTGMAILLLEKDGILHFDDPIRRWLPDMPASVGNRVTIRHLLTHTSGLLDYENLIPPTQTEQVLDADILQLLKSHDTTLFPPGTKFRYSNSGFCLLALIIEAASHRSYASFLRQRIFQPLHMDHSTVYEKDRSIDHRAMGYARDKAGHIVPSDQSITSASKGDGGVYTSLADYSKWIRALQQNRLLPLAPTLHRLRLPITGNPDSYYAAGWFELTSSPALLFHSGSTCGFSNFVIQLPGDEWTIVYFSNIADNSAPFHTIVQILKDNGGPDLSGVFRLHMLTQ